MAPPRPSPPRAAQRSPFLRANVRVLRPAGTPANRARSPRAGFGRPHSPPTTTVPSPFAHPPRLSLHSSTSLVLIPRLLSASPARLSLRFLLPFLRGPITPFLSSSPSLLGFLFPIIRLLLHLPSVSALSAASHQRNLFRPGVPTRSQTSASTLGTAACAGPSTAPEARAPRPVPGVIPKLRPRQPFLPATREGRKQARGPLLQRVLLEGYGGHPGRMQALRPQAQSPAELHSPPSRGGRAARGPEATSDAVCGRGPLYLPGAGAGPTLAKRSRHPPSPHWALGMGGGEGELGENRDVVLPKSKVSLPQVSPPAPQAEFARHGERE